MEQLQIPKEFTFIQMGMVVNDYQKIFKALFNLESIPDCGCVYSFKQAGEFLYIGTSSQLKTRIKRHILGKNDFSKYLINCLVNKIQIDLVVLYNRGGFKEERIFINKHKPKFNKI